MSELEIEVTYLAKYLPPGLEESPHSEIYDKLLTNDPVSRIRLRQQDDTYNLTKKTKPDSEDASTHIEQTIELSQTEFELMKTLPGLELHKTRYFYDYNGLKMEVDVFQDNFEGLVTVECEFPTRREKDTFVMPDFCLVDVTQEKFISFAYGTTYEDFQDVLNKYSYVRLC